jgi:hypothetical protein
LGVGQHPELDGHGFIFVLKPNSGNTELSPKILDRSRQALLQIDARLPI